MDGRQAVVRASRRGASQGLKVPLEHLYRNFDYQGRVARDAIRFPLRYADPSDREVVGLLTACLAYGRVELFSRALERVLAAMGPSPAAFVRTFQMKRDGVQFDDFLYRLNRPRDLVALCLALQRILAEHGSLEDFFLEGYVESHPDIGPALDRFSRGFLEADLRRVFPGGTVSRGYRHLFPLPSTGGPCKRLNLFLRWMVRREPPDFGLWRRVSPAKLVIPLDTHIENMSRAVGLTRRRTRDWRMASAITRRLARLDPDDPVKYDFALCHKRMSGDCPGRRDVVVCRPCGLRSVCARWRGVRHA
jgi:uncharacterized protein (TIGR02757 family)